MVLGLILGVSQLKSLQASECMGLPIPGRLRDDETEAFSHDILKFELSGPEYENFSVVDLPGLFRSMFDTFNILH